MISIFFTRANYHNNIDSYLNYLDEDGDQLGFEGAIFQITFENDRLVTNVINKDNSVETRRDAVILIEDTLSVDNDAIKNEDYLLISKEDFIKSIPSDEAIVIYHHYSSWSEKHQKIDDWFVGFDWCVDSEDIFECVGGGRERSDGVDADGGTFYSEPRDAFGSIFVVESGGKCGGVVV